MTQRSAKQGIRLTQAEYDELLYRHTHGQGYREIAMALNCSEKTIYRHLRRPPSSAPKPRTVRSSLRLSLEEREEISRGLLGGKSLRAIARALGRSPSTISREVRRSGRRSSYRGWKAENKYVRRSKRSRPTKFEANPALKAKVEQRLELRWSPQQISAWLRIEYADDPSMQVSHETIYQSLFIQSRGTLRKQLTRYLRTQRTRRKSQNRIETRGKIANMIMIRERPAEVEDRAVPGHWEGDLIIGKDGQSAMATLVERRSRFVMLVLLPTGRTAEDVCGRLATHFKLLPLELRKSLTWDQGSELSAHATFSMTAEMQVYFCDPHSPWQRGSNENTNGLLRQYFPKKTNLSVHSQEHLNEVAMELNQRPRKTLNWKTPADVLEEAVASLP